ncbi:MAG TPA: holo-ACP synthase [Acidimicrobiales bacterium]|nr:holo-ACP synthase [Acidimicrobiales bacterium]
MIVGIGVDEVEVPRMAEVLTRTPSMRGRLFTDAEQAYAATAEPLMAAQRLAARFAAKEAVLKALGAGLGACKFVEIEVVRAESGAPDVVLHGAAVTLAADAGVARLHLSLTHTESRATAFVIAEG